VPALFCPGSAAFTPPLFGAFGKKTKDLFKKKFDFEHQLKVVNNNADAKNIETSVVFPTDKQVRGVFKSSIPVSNLAQANGVFETEFHTVADKESKTSYKFTNLFNGGFVKLGVTSVKADAKNDTADFPEYVHNNKPLSLARAIILSKRFVRGRAIAAS